MTIGPHFDDAGHDYPFRTPGSPQLWRARAPQRDGHRAAVSTRSRRETAQLIRLFGRQGRRVIWSASKRGRARRADPSSSRIPSEGRTNRPTTHPAISAYFKRCSRASVPDSAQAMSSTPDPMAPRMSRP